MKKKLTFQILICFILGISFCLPNFVHASSQETQEQNCPIKPEYFIEFANYLVGLNLTEAQKTGLKELTNEIRNNIKPLISEMKALRNQMNETILAEEIDTKKAHEQIEKMIALKSQITNIMLSTKLKGVQVLIPEQRKIILDKKNEWKERFQHWRESLRFLLR
jgi:Spy/CpxP family protein refolding chaperone